MDRRDFIEKSALAAGGVLLSASGAKALEHKDSKKNMKVLLINGSPRPKGNTSIALAEVVVRLVRAIFIRFTVLGWSCPETIPGF